MSIFGKTVFSLGGGLFYLHGVFLSTHRAHFQNNSLRVLLSANLQLSALPEIFQKDCDCCLLSPESSSLHCSVT